MPGKWDFKRGGSYTLPEQFQYLKDLLGTGGQILDFFGSSAGLEQDDKKELEFLLGGTPIFGDLLGMRDAYNQMNDYLKNSGMTWADLLYPTRGSFMGSGAMGFHALNFTSSNIKKLYEDHRRLPLKGRR